MATPVLATEAAMLASPLPNPRHETFARCLAGGLTNAAAARAAGYRGDSSFIPRLARKPEIRARTAHLARMLPWSGSRDLVPVIEEMVRVVQAATRLESAAACKAAGELLVMIAELKLSLPPDAGSTTAGAAARPPPAPMALEAWIREFQPKP